MESTSSPRSNINQQNRDDGEDVTQKLFTIQSSATRDKLEQEPVETTSENIKKSSNDIPESINKPHKDSSEVIEKINTVRINAVDNSTVKDTSAEIFDTTRLPAQTEVEKILETPTSALKTNHRQGINRGKAIPLHQLALDSCYSMLLI